MSAFDDAVFIHDHIGDNWKFCPREGTKQDGYWYTLGDDGGGYRLTYGGRSSHLALFWPVADLVTRLGDPQYRHLLNTRPLVAAVRVLSTFPDMRGPVLPRWGPPEHVPWSAMMSRAWRETGGER